MHIERMREGITINDKIILFHFILFYSVKNRIPYKLLNIIREGRQKWQLQK